VESGRVPRSSIGTMQCRPGAGREKGDVDDDLEAAIESGRFISGIYNYCDRWCEQCRFSDRCLVYHQEQRTLERHRLAGEDPDDPEVFVRDLEATLGQTLSMLEKMAAQAGVNLDEAADEEPEEEPDPQSQPLYKRGERWSQRIGVLLQWVGSEISARGERLIGAAGSADFPDVETAVEALTRLRDSCELLSRYRFLIAVKLARALRSGTRGERRRAIAAAAALDDSLGTAKLVDACLERATKALWTIGEFHRPWLDMAMPLATEAEGIRKGIEVEFPRFRAFIRPGFDEEPA
jgi:hypothetical protein